MRDEGRFDEALRLHQQGHIEEAEAAYLQVLEGEPNHPGGLHLLGVIRQQQGRHAEAVELIGRAIEVNPAKAVYRNNYGAALLSLDRLDEAADSFQRALAICPQYPDALANLGLVQTARDEEAAAEASFRQALQIQPGHRDATTRLVAFLGKRGRDAEALQILEAALAAAPCPEFHAALGNLLFGTGLPEQAAEQYRAAIRLKPGDAIAHFNLGMVCEELHDAAAAARQHFARAAELRPEKRLWRLRAELCGPVVFEDSRVIEEYWEKVEAVLERWKAEEPSPPAPLPGHHVPMVGARGGLSDILEAGVLPGLRFSYHGRNLRRLKERFAAMYEPWFCDQPVGCVKRTGGEMVDPSSLNPNPSSLIPYPSSFILPCSRPRVGILVTRRHEGMFLQSMQGVIEQLDGDRFELVTDRDYRKYVTERIVEASDVLFNDIEAASEHERFFEEALGHVG